MSLPPATPPTVAKTPFLAAAALCLAAASLVFALSLRPLGAAELLGLLACVAAASAFATFPFAVDFARRLDSSRPAAAETDADRLAARIASAVESRLDASADRRRDELLRAAAVAAGTSAPRPADTDAIAAPAGAKPRLGRGLAGLMHAPAALTKPPASPAPADTDRAAA